MNISRGCRHQKEGMGMRTEQLLSWAVPWHKVGWLSKARTSQDFQKQATTHGIPIYTLPSWDISSPCFPGIQHFSNHSAPSYVGAQTLTLLKNLVYLPLTQLQQGERSFSCNPTVPKVVGKDWLRSPLCNLLISDIPPNWFNKSCLLKWKPSRQKLSLAIQVLARKLSCKIFLCSTKSLSRNLSCVSLHVKLPFFFLLSSYLDNSH